MTRIDADWLDAPGPQAVCAALAAQGHRALFVGGCVRNALLGRRVTDIDIATDARPEASTKAAEAAGLKAVPTGADHGTITVVAAGQGFEVTTFRRDVETDGRHAIVHFSDRLEDDAARRDFTMNALYADPEGQVLDPIGGLPDLRAGRLRFIGDPNCRIAEDYLRILRFFRFHAWYADPRGGFDSAGLAACAAGVDGLARLPAERIGAEMRKLLAAPDPAPAVAAMARTKVLERVLPGVDHTALTALIAAEQVAAAAPDALRRLGALGGTDPVARLRLTRDEARRLADLQRALGAQEAPAVRAYRYGIATASSAALIEAARTATLPPEDLEADLQLGANAVFPVMARDLMPAREGAALGAELRRLEEAWIASGFTLSRDALLAMA